MLLLLPAGGGAAVQLQPREYDVEGPLARGRLAAGPLRGEAGADAVPIRARLQRRAKPGEDFPPEAVFSGPFSSFPEMFVFVCVMCAFVLFLTSIYRANKLAKDNTPAVAAIRAERFLVMYTLERNTLLSGPVRGVRLLFSVAQQAWTAIGLPG